MSDSPPTPDAGAGFPDDDGGDDDRPQIVVNDPEDFAKTRQLRSIFDALDDYQEMKRKALRSSREGEITAGEKNRYIFEYMQDFAMTVEPIAKSHETGVKLWEEKTYSFDGTVVHKLGLSGSKDAKSSVLEPLIKQHVDGMPTKAELQKVIDIVGFDLPDEDLKKIEEHFASDARERVNTTTQEAQRLLTADADKLSRISLARAQSGLEQMASPDPVPEPPAADVADGIYEAVENQRKTSRKKGEFALRKYATSWGWETTGIESMIGSVPHLFYPGDDDRHFRPTAPPRPVSDEVVGDLRQLIQDLGLGINFDESQQTKIDGNLLDEVDDWRGSNT